MNWKYKLKRLVTNRFALSAILFLALTAAGAFSALFGVLDGATACAGYVRPSLVKTDPQAPSRAVAAPALPSGALDAPAPLAPWSDQVARKTAAAEAGLQEVLTDQHLLIQLYGGFQRLTGRTVVEDAADPTYSVTRLQSGLLTFATGDSIDPNPKTATLKRLQHALDDRGISLLYLQAPSKVEPGVDSLPYGVTDASNQNADALLAALEDAGIDCLDLRQTLQDAGGDWADWFYATDHHWNQEGAFVAFQALADKLADYDQTTTVSRGGKTSPIVMDGKWTRRDAYDITTLPSAFLGSQGKRVGSLYAGMDDFDLWVPKSPTLLRYDAANPARHGDAEETVLYPERLEAADPFAANPYTYYAGGDYGFTRVTNYYNPQGPRILLVRDSFACALTPYLAYSCSELAILDPRYFQGDFLHYVDWVDPDVVLVMYAPGTLRTEAAFSFLSQPAAPSKGDVLRWKQDEP